MKETLNAVKTAAKETSKAVSELKKEVAKAAAPVAASVKEDTKEIKKDIAPVAQKVKDAAKTAVSKAEPKLKEVAKTVAEKTAPTVEEVKKAVKATEKKVTAVQPKVYVQFGQCEASCEQVVERCQLDFKAKHKGTIRSCRIYIKPEDGMAYYVINDIEDHINL